MDGGSDEEVQRDQALGVILEKGPPGLGGRLPMSDHVFGHGRLTQFDSNLQQFPMNARSAPARVGEAHLTDQIANFRRYRRAAIGTPTLPPPIELKSPAMPRDDGLRLDHQQRAAKRNRDLSGFDAINQA